VASIPPDRGDVIWLDFDPTSGHEQGGHRPAIVLSPREYNQRSGLMLVVPVTNQAKGYPFEVRLPRGLPVSGVVLADQVRSVSWLTRRIERIGRLPPEIEAVVRGAARRLLE
jgi:mRNA interferase MazF